jgi:acyl-CoA thioester hydrolase
MTIEYTMRFPVRRYEVDRFGFVHDHVYQQYLEEAAIQASTAAGFGPQWYDEHGTVWVVREITVEYLHPAGMNDELEIRTWVADMQRVRSHREYEIYRLPDRRLLVRADADWVYIDRARLWPTRIPAEARMLFSASGRFAVPPARPVPPLSADRQRPAFVCRRRVQRHEVDGMGHVNNAVYVTWFEQALMDTLAAWLPTAVAPGWPCYRRHQIEYLSAILPGEEVEIVTQLIGMGRARAMWYQEVRRVDSEDVAAKDHSIVLYLDERRRPRPWPRTLAAYPAGVQS